jgi:hypothetical protein
MARTGSARWDGGDLYELSVAAQALLAQDLYLPDDTPDRLCAALLRVHTAAEAVSTGPVPGTIMVALDGVRTTGGGGRRASRSEGGRTPPHHDAGRGHRSLPRRAASA